MKAKLSIIIMLVSLCLMSCEREREYVIFNNTGLTGTVYVHEYNDINESINIQSATIQSGSSRTFTSNTMAEKLKLYIYELDCWVQQVYYLDEPTTSIVIEGNTIVGPYEP